MDQVNPLSGLTHRRRLSALGPGGLSRERAGFEVRDVHFSHYGRMCPIETPEGPNIGLIGALCDLRPASTSSASSSRRTARSTNGKVTDEIRLPGRRRGRGLRRRPGQHADQRRRHLRRTRVLVRRSPQAASLEDLRLHARAESFFGATTDIALGAAGRGRSSWTSRPKQIVSVATALIPFLEHDDANRALMGANMQTPGRAAAARRGAVHRHRHRGPRRPRRRRPASQATDDGDGRRGRRLDDHGRATRRAASGSTRLSKFRRSNQDTCINQRPRVNEGDEVVKGDDPRRRPVAPTTASWRSARTCSSPSCRGRATTSRTPSSSASASCKDDVLTSIHIHEHEVDARDTKLGPEEITRDIPNLSEDILERPRRARHHPRRRRGRPGRRARRQGHAEGRDRARPRRSACCAPSSVRRPARSATPRLKVPHGETGKVIDVKVFSRDDGHELPPGVNQLVRVYVAQKRKISVGDKLAGRHGNKGVISKILPIEDMPYLADGTPVDIILNPLGVPSRMNVGQVLEAHLGYARPLGLDDDGASRSATSRSAAPRPRPRPITQPRDVDRHPGVRRRALGRGASRRASTRPIQQRSSRTSTRTSADGAAASSSTDGKTTLLQRPHRRAVRQPDHGRLHVHPEAGPPRRRQDPRPLDRPVLDDHPAAAGR